MLLLRVQRFEREKLAFVLMERCSHLSRIIYMSIIIYNQAYKPLCLAIPQQ